MGLCQSCSGDNRERKISPDHLNADKAVRFGIFEKFKKDFWLFSIPKNQQNFTKLQDNWWFPRPPNKYLLAFSFVVCVFPVLSFPFYSSFPYFSTIQQKCIITRKNFSYYRPLGIKNEHARTLPSLSWRFYS